MFFFFYFYGILLVVAKQDRTSKKKKILQAKKAFNMSIILASLNSLNNKSTEERDKRVEQALLQVEVQVSHFGVVHSVSSISVSSSVFQPVLKVSGLSFSL